MTKNQKRKSKSSKHRVSLFRRPWMVFLILIVLVAVVIALLIWFKPQPNSTVENQPVATNPTTPDSTDQPGSSDAPVVESPADPEDKTTQYEGGDPNTLGTLTGSIARKTVDGGILTVVAAIDQYLNQPGICIIELKDSARQLMYTASSDAVPDVTTSICEPFVIPVSQFAAGKYTIEIQVSGDNKQGTITEEVEL